MYEDMYVRAYVVCVHECMWTCYHIVNNTGKECCSPNSADIWVALLPAFHFSSQHHSHMHVYLCFFEHLMMPYLLCMYVYKCVCMYVCMYVSVFVCMSMSMSMSNEYEYVHSVNNTYFTAQTLFSLPSRYLHNNTPR